MSKYTAWFPGDVKPVRVGVYERAVYGKKDLMRFAYWDGKRWHSARYYVTSAMTAELSGYQIGDPDAPPWRGLAEKPQ